MIPHRPVIARSPPKNHLFLDRDSGPDGEPVAHDSKEISEDLTEMVPAGEGADEVDDDTDGGPYEARDARCGAAEELEIDAADVGGEDAVGDDAEGDDDGEEAAEGVEAGGERCDDEGALAGGVGGGVGGGGGDAGGEADAGDEAEGEGAGEAEGGEGKDERARGVRGVVDEGVGCAAGVGYCCGEAEGEKG